MSPPDDTELDRLRARNADLENIAQAMSRRCYIRLAGCCDLSCPGRTVCNAEGLTPLSHASVPVTFREALCKP